MPRARLTWRSQVLPKMETTGVPASTRARTLRAGCVLGDPLSGEFAGLDFGEDFFHFGAGLIVDDARAAGVVAVFGGVADAVTHVAEAAFLDEVHDQLEFVE